MILIEILKGFSNIKTSAPDVTKTTRGPFTNQRFNINMFSSVHRNRLEFLQYFNFFALMLKTSVNSRFDHYFLQNNFESTLTTLTVSKGVDYKGKISIKETVERINLEKRLATSTALLKAPRFNIF